LCFYFRKIQKKKIGGKFKKECPGKCTLLYTIIKGEGVLQLTFNCNKKKLQIQITKKKKYRWINFKRKKPLRLN
jgi:hypothetical protein